MANTSSRMLRLLSLLRTHRFWPGSEFAERLEVSPRTLRRDDEEAVAIVVGLRTAANGMIEGISESSVRALAKVTQVMPSRLRHRVEALTTMTVTGGWPNGSASGAAGSAMGR